MTVTASVTYERRVEKPRAVSSAGVERRAKRETALVSYNVLDATLTGRIMYTLTPTPSFEYDTPVSKYFSQETEVSFARWDEWFYAKEACFEQGEKQKQRSAVSGAIMACSCSFFSLIPPISPRIPVARSQPNCIPLFTTISWARRSSKKELMISRQWSNYGLILFFL